jgi:hypothetical protein
MDWSDKPFLPYQLGTDYAGVYGKCAVTLGADGNGVVPN